MSLRYFLACGMKYIRRNRRQRIISPMIERLHNLEHLCLGSTGNLDNLPNEIGNLPKLDRLCLEGPERIQTPSTLKNLQNLTRLVLRSRTKIDVHDLDVIRMIPNLTHFVFLDLNEKKALKYTTEELQQILQIVQQSRYLGSIDHVLEKHIPGLTYALACNRFHKHCNGSNPFYVSELSQERLLQKLWPFILTNATQPFRRWTPKQCSITAHDAVYTLLTKGRGSFLQVLHQRNSSERQDNNHK